MKKLLFILLMLPLTMVAQDTFNLDPNHTLDIVQVVNTDSSTVITIPSTFNPSDPDSIFEWWIFIYGLLMPIGLWILHRVWPSQTKKTLILKSTSVAIVVLMMIVYSNGMSIMSIGQAALAFIMQVFGYDKLLKPLGMDSPKPRNYRKE